MKKLLIAAMLLTTPAMAQTDIVISKKHQTMQVFKDGENIGNWPVSTARPGYYTPTGTFHPYSLQTMHYSRKYDNAPMPHSIFFSGGYAIHATPHTAALGHRASHGCVRLSRSNASYLFNIVKRDPDTTIRIDP